MLRDRALDGLETYLAMGGYAAYVWPAFGVAAVVLFAIAPALLSSFRLSLLAQFLCYAIVAVGIGLEIIFATAEENEAITRNERLGMSGQQFGVRRPLCSNFAPTPHIHDSWSRSW